MPKSYESASGAEKALGKLHQYSARLLNQTRRALPEGQKVVSLCFDDFPESAASQGAAVLQQAGARGTFYTCFGLLGQEGYGGKLAQLWQVQALQEAGHEIGCHTYNHVNASFNALEKFSKACAENKKTADALSIKLLQFSYPEGGMSRNSKQFIKQNYQSARGGFYGINKGGIDVHCLRSVPLYMNRLQKISSYVDALAAKGGWLILYTHDVSNTPSEQGISLQALGDVLKTLRQKNIAIRPVGQVVQTLRDRHAA